MMKSPTLAALAAALAAVLALGALAGSAPRARRAPDALAFPVPAGPAEIPAQVDGRPATVADLLAVYSAATGQRLVLSPEDAESAASTPLGLTRAIPVRAERLQTVFEGLLAEREFVLQVVSHDGPRVLSARGPGTHGRADLSGRATFVAPGRLDLMRAHPAMVLTTVLQRPDLDVAMLANSLRTLQTDPDTQRFLPAGASTSIVLTARGGLLATWVEALGSVR